MTYQKYIIDFFTNHADRRRECGHPRVPQARRTTSVNISGEIADDGCITATGFSGYTNAYRNGIQFEARV